MTHLLGLGHRNVLAYNEGTPGQTNVEGARWAGYYEASRKIGADPSQHIVVGAWKHQDLTGAAKELRAVLARRTDITAIVANNDLQALQIHQALTQAGLRVPEDISLISYDDTETIFDGRGNNILTTVRLPLEDVGRIGAQLLLRRVLGEETEDRQIVLPVELIVRGSTAPPNPRRC